MNCKTLLLAAALSTEACVGSVTQKNTKVLNPENSWVSQVYVDKSWKEEEAYSWVYNGQFKNVDQHRWGVGKRVDAFIIEDIIADMRSNLRQRTESCVKTENMPKDFRWKALRRCDRKVGSSIPYINELFRLNIPEETARKILREVMVLDPNKEHIEGGEEDLW